jgi:hypothetical protein
MYTTNFYPNSTDIILILRRQHVHSDLTVTFKLLNLHTRKFPRHLWLGALELNGTQHSPVCAADVVLLDKQMK